MTVQTLLQAAGNADYDFKDIPIIDMKDADSPDPSVRRQLANVVRDACINVGFFYVKNHGIPEEHIKMAVGAGKKFFALPTETKMKYDVNQSPTFIGYNALMSQNSDPANTGDLHEAFNIGPEENDTRTGFTEEPSPNLWPTADLPEFQEETTKYYDDAVGLAKKLLPLFALALDLREDFFVDKSKEVAATMRVIHYPPQTGPHDDRVIGIGAHTDFEAFTILWQQPGVPALEVLNVKNEWIKAPPIPGTLVINLGDELAMWTNDVFRSTKHRAINRTGVERYSMPLFFGVDYGVMLEPIPTCVSDERPAKYKPILAKDYVKDKVDIAYQAKKAKK